MRHSNSKTWKSINFVKHLLTYIYNPKKSFKLKSWTFFIFISDGSNNVRSSMFDRSKPKIGCSSSITNRWTRSSSFDVRKNDVRDSLKSNLVNLVKALLGSKFDVRSFEAKNRVFEFVHQQMNTFEFVRCSKNDVPVRSMFDKMVFDPSLLFSVIYFWIEVNFSVKIPKRYYFARIVNQELAINPPIQCQEFLLQCLWLKMHCCVLSSNSFFSCKSLFNFRVGSTFLAKLNVYMWQKGFWRSFWQPYTFEITFPCICGPSTTTTWWLIKCLKQGTLKYWEQWVANDLS